MGDARDICFVSADNEANEVEIVVGAVTAPLSLGVVGTKLTITSANVDGSPTSTAAEIVDAVNENVGASALFTARLPPGSNGGGVTGALAEMTAADGVDFTALELADSGDHKKYQASSESRYWDDRYSLTVKSDGVAVTTGFRVNFLRGLVVFDNSMEGHTITVDGTRRSILAFEKIPLTNILYGSDLPILFWHGKREYTEKQYTNLCRENYSWNKHLDSPENEEKYTLFIYEQLRAILDAADMTGLDNKNKEAIFYDNAYRLLV